MGSYFSSLWVTESDITNMANGKFKYIKTVVLDPIGEPGYGCKFFFDIPPLSQEDLVNNTGQLVYKNIRFSSDKYNSVIKHCEFEYKETILDSINGNTFDLLRELHGYSDNTTIPFHFHNSENCLPVPKNLGYRVNVQPISFSVEESMSLADELFFDNIQIYVDMYEYIKE